MDIQIESILQGGHFKRLHEERIIELRQKYGMKKAELEILYFLSHCGEHNTSSDIHNQLMMNKGHISQAVNSLYEKGLIIAVPDKDDRRYVHYAISDSAKDIINEITLNRKKMNQQILEGISEEELKVFKQVAAKIAGNIEILI
ncbi:MAG: winged helix-turn-helix transcriptional regulator [Ruminococcus sp.]|nr:winged helix-turn-helix transcriptional regulator [Ruminococcus sp.]